MTLSIFLMQRVVCSLFKHVMHFFVFVGLQRVVGVFEPLLAKVEILVPAKSIIAKGIVE